MIPIPRDHPLDATLAVVLAGGQGRRLQPLTRQRTKAAVPFGGAFRLIDFTLANCVHSRIRRISVLPQYKFASLERHLREHWSLFHPALDEYIALVPPQQRSSGEWYQGTADAVHESAYTLQPRAPAHLLVLSCDHVYRMDYTRLLEAHANSGADLTIACTEVDLEEAHRFGILDVDGEARITAFTEKPTAAVSAVDAPGCALASMGVYVFDSEALFEVLALDARQEDSTHDFGHDIIPRMLREGRKLRAYDVNRREQETFYWRDIGTVDAYWQASMELLSTPPPLDLFDPDWSVPACRDILPARFTRHGSSHWVCPGCRVVDAEVRRSILSPDVEVAAGALVEDSVLMAGVRVGAGARVRRAVIDKGVVVPPGVALGPQDTPAATADEGPCTLSPGGVTVVPKGESLLHGAGSGAAVYFPRAQGEEEGADEAARRASE